MDTEKGEYISYRIINGDNKAKEKNKSNIYWLEIFDIIISLFFMGRDNKKSV